MKKVTNRKTAWNATPNDSSYPSEKLAKDTFDTKVDKTMTILGIDHQDNILRAEFVTALGNATTELAGLLMRLTNKDLTLYTLLGGGDADAVVNTITEVLAIFASYPEGADLVAALAGKVDKVAGKALSSNDYTDVEKYKLASFSK